MGGGSALDVRGDILSREMQKFETDQYSMRNGPGRHSEMGLNQSQNINPNLNQNPPQNNSYQMPQLRASFNGYRGMESIQPNQKPVNESSRYGADRPPAHRNYSSGGGRTSNPLFGGSNYDAHL